MNRKIEQAKLKKANEAKREQLTAKELESRSKLIEATERLYELINGQEQFDFDKLYNQLGEIDKRLDLAPIFKSLESTLKLLTPPQRSPKTKIEGISELISAVKNNKPLPVKIDLSAFEKAIVNIEQYIREQSEPSDQGAENYQPVRRVIKVGNRFIFDDNFSNAGGGGGGSSGGGSTTVSNFPSEYPLPAAQVATLAPPAAITGYLTESDFDTKTGSLTETAPATDTASSGLNGRLQRLAQRITSLIALLPGSLGQKARAASLAVTLSSEDITALTPPTPQTDALTDAQLRDTAVPVSGTFFQATQPVSGTVTETNSNAIKTAVELIDNAISGAGFNITQLGGAAVPIGAGTEAAAVRVTLPTNGTGIVGLAAGTTGATDGFPLEPGESITLPVNNSNLLYAIGAAANQKVFWSAV